MNRIKQLLTTTEPSKSFKLIRTITDFLNECLMCFRSYVVLDWHQGDSSSSSILCTGKPSTVISIHRIVIVVKNRKGVLIPV